MRILQESVASSGTEARSNCLDPFTTWLLGATVALGVIVLWERSTVWIPVLALLATVSAVGAAIRVWRESRDALNPVSLIVVIAAVRFGLPAVLALFGSGLDDVPIFQLLRLQRQDWLFGYTIGVTGIAALLLGWQVAALTRSAGDPCATCSRQDPGTPLWAPTFAATVGLLALVAFVITNGVSFVTAARTGSFRGVEVQQGTGIFFRLSFLLIVGSVTIVHALLARRDPSDRAPWSVFAPVLCAAFAFFVLGGRARAFIAIAAAFLLWWYRPSSDQRVRSATSLRSRKMLLVCAPLSMMLFSYLGSTYRGADTPGRGNPVGVEDFGQYLSGTFAIDAGALHSLAVASKLPPGILEGRSFLGALTFPVSQFGAVQGRSTGVYLVEGVIGRTQRKWGFSPTIFGEAYVNFGLLGLILVPGTIGFLFQRLYSRVRSGRTSVLFYALLAVYLLRIVFESIEKWPETLTILVMLWGITRFRQDDAVRPSP